MKKKLLLIVLSHLATVLTLHYNFRLQFSFFFDIKILLNLSLSLTKTIHLTFVHFETQLICQNWFSRMGQRQFIVFIQTEWIQKKKTKETYDNVVLRPWWICYSFRFELTWGEYDVFACMNVVRCFCFFVLFWFWKFFFLSWFIWWIGEWKINNHSICGKYSEWKLISASVEGRFSRCDNNNSVAEIEMHSTIENKDFDINVIYWFTLLGMREKW